MSDSDGERTRKRSRSPASGVDYGNLDSDVDDGFGPDLMGDDADREYLAGLNELERETVLADRAERREKELNRRRTLRQRAIAAGTYKAPNRDDVAASESRQASEAAKGPAAKKRAALQDLKAQRAARAAGGGGAAAAAAAAARAAARDERDDEDEEDEYVAAMGVSDEDEDDRRGGGRGGKRGDRRRRSGLNDEEEDEDAEYPDVIKAQLRRATLEKWAAEPFLPRYAPGCTVRVALNGKYLAAEVTAVVSRPHGPYNERDLPPTPCPYRLSSAAAAVAASSSKSPSSSSSAAAPTMTDRWLEVTRCGKQKLIPFSIVSNQPISEAELDEWSSMQTKQGHEPYSRARARAAAEGLRAAAAYVYTEEDVAAMIAAKKKAAAAALAAARRSPSDAAAAAPPSLAAAGITNVAAERARLISARDFAFAAGDREGVAKASKDLEALTAADAAARARRDAGGRDAALAALNARNARRNVANSLEDVGTVVADAAADAKAAAAEAAALLSPEGKGAAAAAAALASNAKVADPFRRRETRPKHMWATSGSRRAAGESDADATTRAEQEVADEAAAEAAAAAAEEESKLSPSKAAARASKLLESTFQRPIPALEIDVSEIEAELAEARQRSSSSAAGAGGGSGGFSEIARTLLGANWRPTPLPGAAELKKISLEEYKRRQGLA